jgi:hypothetical protein
VLVYTAAAVLNKHKHGEHPQRSRAPLLLVVCSYRVLVSIRI